MKALVIGASGLAGAALFRALRTNGEFDKSLAIEVKGTYFSHKEDGLDYLDITDHLKTRDYIYNFSPDVIFLATNNAGGVDYCETHPNEAYEFHTRSTYVIAEAAQAVGAKTVFYSTAYVFDGQRAAHSEEDKTHPLNIYGHLKNFAEYEFVRGKNLIIRTISVFGWNKNSTNFAMQIWKNLKANRRMSVPSDQWSNPILAESLAQITLRLLTKGAVGIFNVAGKETVSRHELAVQLATAMGLDTTLLVPILTSWTDQGAQRPLNSVLKLDKLRNTLQIDPPNLSESIAYFGRMVGKENATPQLDAATLKKEILEKVKQYYEIAHQPEVFVPNESRVQFAGRVYGSREMINLVDSATDFWLTLGPYGDLFEQKMIQYFRARDFVLVNSGSSANLAAILALMSHQLETPLAPGDEVITPAVTFPTTLAPIVHSGLIPVFVDCELGTYNIDSYLIEEAISPKTRALMIPHTLGNPCDMEMITHIAKKYNLFLIEDNCDSLGSTFNGKLTGTFGDLATLSFYPAHHMTMGEGGGVVVNNPTLTKIVRSVRDWGRDCWCPTGKSNTCGKRFDWQLGQLPYGYDHKYTYSNIGYNLKPTDLQAAIGVAQFDRLGSFIQKRRYNFKRLALGLREYEQYLILPRVSNRADPSPFGFPITVSGIKRTDLVQFLEKANIETRQLFGGNILRQPGYQNIRHRIHGILYNSDRVMRDTFFIGVYPGITDDMIDFVLGTFKKFFASMK